LDKWEGRKAKKGQRYLESSLIQRPLFRLAVERKESFSREEIATSQDIMLALCMLERGQHAGLKKKGKLVCTRSE
jgi:hypothetical protein